MEDRKIKIPLGTPVKDILTGFVGIISAYTFHLTGCDVVAIKRRDLDKDGKVPEVLWVDVTRVKATGEIDPEIAQVAGGDHLTGGPQDIPQSADK